MKHNMPQVRFFGGKNASQAKFTKENAQQKRFFD